MPNYQLYVIAGHVGRVDGLRYTSEGTAVISFTVAVNNPFRRDDPPQWFRVTCWRQSAEFVNEYLTVGAAVLIEAGDLKVDQWTDNEGTPRVTLEITARNVQLLGSRGERTQAEQQDSPF
jgi:single-strand DNA-binding protein